MRKSAAFIVLTVLAAINLLSCQIGLGSAVDVEAPTVEFTNPPIDSRIRGTFHVGGTFSDDGIIGEVKVKLEGTDGNNFSFEYKGTINQKDGLWDVEIDPKAEGQPVPDGSYQATVSVRDMGAHTTVQTRSFTIDNTPPVVVLQRPAAKTSDSAPDSYGQTFTLTGQAADDSDIALIELLVYADAERQTLLNTISLNNVPPTISLDAAKFVEGTDNDYSKIYGSTSKVGTKELYCSIRAYDGAQFYPAEGNQSTEDLRGNCTTYYYLYEDISTAVLANYKITEVYHMANGSFKTANAETTAADVIAEVNKTLEKNKIEVGFFSLNPANNPHFTVSGHDQLSKNGEDFKLSNTTHHISNGSAVVMEVSTGLDAIPLVADSLRVYVVPCDSNGNEIEGAARIYPSDSARTKSGTTYKFVSALSTSDGLRIGSNYIFGVEGTDENKNPVVATGNGYGFHFISNGKPPAIELKAKINGKEKSDAIIYVPRFNPDAPGSDTEIEIWGTVKVDDETAPDFEISLDNIAVPGSELTATGTGVYTFKKIITTDKFSGTESAQHSITVAASNGTVSSVNKTVMLDFDGPQINFDDSSVSPVAYKYTDEDGSREMSGTEYKEFLNGEIRIKLSIVDAFDTVEIADPEHKPTIEFIKNGTPVAALTQNNITKPSKIDITGIDTTRIANAGDPETDVTIKVTAYDRAGNKSIFTKTFTVNQDTDNPVILPGNPSKLTLKNTYGDITTVGASKNLFPSGGTVNFTLIDDDGLEDYNLYYISTNSNTVTKATATLAQNESLGNNSEYRLMYTLPSEQGNYAFWLEVKDKNGKTTNAGWERSIGDNETVLDGNGTNQPKPFFIKITAPAPTVTLTADTYVTTNVPGSLYTDAAADLPKTKLKVAVNIESSEGPFTVKRADASTSPEPTAGNDYIKDSTGANITTVPAPGGGSTSVTVDDYFEPAANTSKVKYFVEDKNRQVGSRVLTYKIDNTKPEVKITSTAVSATSGATSNNFYGTAKDTDSGIKLVQYKIDNGAWNDADGSTAWIKEINFSDSGAGALNLSEGSHTFYVRSIDAVGNISSEDSQTFVYDKAAPTITTNIGSDSSIIAKTSTYTLSFKPDDTWGIDNNKTAVSVKKDGSPVSSNIGTVAGGYYPITVPAGDGLFEYTISVTDNAGKTTTVTRNIRLDTAGPVLSNISPDFDDAGTWMNSDSVTVTGEAGDASGVSAVFYKFDADGTATAPTPHDSVTVTDWTGAAGGNWTKATGSTVWSFAVNGIKEGISGKLYISAVDVNGKSTALVTKTIKMDKALPELNVTASTILQYMPETGFKIRGTAKDSYKLAASNALKVTQTFTPSVGAAGTPISVYINSVNGAANALTNWEIDVPFDGTGTHVNASTDGTYKYMFELKDAAGKTTSSQTYSTTVDKTGPTVTITNPGANLQGVDSISELSPSFRGTVNDETGIISGVYYKIQKKTVPAPSPVSSGQNALTVSNWTTAGFTAATSTNSSWNFNPALTEDTDWKLYVYAVDGAGNVSSTAATQIFDVDLSYPTLTAAITADANCTAKNNIYYFNGTNLTGTITAADTAGAVTNTYKVDDGQETALGDSSGSWSIPGNKFTESTTQKLTIITKDKVGKTTSTVFYVFKDTTLPTLGVTTPNAYYDGSADVTLSGTITDMGVGPDKVQWCTTANGTYADVSSYTSGETSWSHTIQKANLGSEGVKDYYFKAIDALGNTTAERHVTFSYDKAAPVLSQTDGFVLNATNYIKENQSFTLEGAVYDSNLVDRVVIYKGDESTPSYSSATAPSTVVLGSVQKPVANAHDVTSAAPWSKDFAVGTLADGSYKLKVTAYDIAGRTSDSITKTFVIDTVAPNVELKALPNKESTKGSSYTFRGTATDITSGVKDIYLTVAGNGKSKSVKVDGDSSWSYELKFTDTATLDDTDGTANSWAEIFATEGVKTVSVKAVDYAGNESAKLTYSGNLVNDVTFVYDKADPVLSVNTTTIQQYMPETGFIVTGTASDSYLLYGTIEGVDSIVVTEKHKGTAANAEFVETDASKDSSKNTFKVNSISNHSGSVSIQLPLNLAGLPNGKPVEGTYKYTITLKDSVEHTTSYEIDNVIVDTTAPVVSVTTPDSNTAKVGTDAISETNFRFEGSITEANAVAGVYYKIISSAEAVPSAPAGNKLLASTWTAADWTAATSGTAAWNANQTFVSGTTNTTDGSGKVTAFCEGLGYKICVFAVDKAGNVNSSAVTRTFDVDLTYPTVDTRVGDGAGNAKTSVSDSGTKVKTSAYTFDFKVEDSLGLDLTTPYTIVLKKDDVSLGTTVKADAPYYSVGSVVGGYYPISITVPSGVKGDGLYEYTVTAKDKAGKTTSVTRNIRLDTTAPELSILSPDLTAYQNTQNVTVKGSAEDDSGTLAVWYAYDVAVEPAVPTTGIKDDSSWTGNWVKASGTTSWEIKDLAGVEGTGKTLFIRAVDKNGLVSGSKNGTVNIDLSAPDLTTSESALITKDDFNFTGSVWDENGMQSVTIVQSGQAAATYSTDSAVESTPSIAVTGGITKLASAKSDGTKAEWSKGFAVSLLSDGVYDYSIKVKDNAGKETIKSRTVTVDKTPPTIGTPTLTWTDTPAAGAAHTVNTAKLAVSPTDDNLESVYYFINNGSDPSITGSSDVSTNLWETIIPMVKNVGGVDTTVYEKDISFSDGDGKVYIKVTDKAGNVSYDTTLVYAVDKTKPEKPVLGTVDGETLSETKMINGSSVVEFVLTARDQNDHYENGAKVGPDVTKVASVNLSRIGTKDVTSLISISSTDYNKLSVADKALYTQDGTVYKNLGTPALDPADSSKTGEWTVKIPTTAFAGLSAGSQLVYVKVTDISGNMEEYEMFSIELDNVEPVASILSPDATTINGTLNVTGTVTETYPKSVGLYYRTAAPASSDHSDKTIAGWTKIEEIVKGVNSATVSDISKFTFKDVDFNTLSGAAAQTDKKHDIYLLVYSEDTAGNASVIENKWKKYDVDMDEDRPVIKFSNINLGAAMSSANPTGFQSSEIYGSVTDDDGVPETVKYYIGDSAPAANSPNWIPSAPDSNFVYSNGSFTLKFLDNNGRPDDGEKKIFFLVTDKTGNIFISTANTAYDVNSVIVTDGNNNYGARGSATASTVYVKVDTQAPDVTDEGYYIGSTVADESKWDSDFSKATFGGKQNQFLLRQYAYDANGVSSVVVHIPVSKDGSGNIVDKLTGAGRVTGYVNTSDATKPSVTDYYEYTFTKQTGAGSTKTVNSIEYTKWISSVIDVTGMKSGIRSCEIIVSDGIKTRITQKNISIDNDAPEVVFESQMPNEQMRAAFLMKGQFTDGDLGTKLWYSLSDSATPGSWSANPVNATTAMNWRIAFDGDLNPQDAYTHDGVPKEIIAGLLSDVEIANAGEHSGKAVWKTAGTGHAAGDLYTPITTVYFHFKVQDSLGNESTTYIPLKLDPQGDIPVITLVSPDSTQTTLGGTIRFSGSAEDDATIAGLYIEVDPHYGWNDSTNSADTDGNEVFRPWSDTHKTPTYTYQKDGSPVTVTGQTPAQVITAANYPNNPYELINTKVAVGKQKPTDVKAIYIGNGLSWNIALNKNGEWNGAATNTVAVRFYAVDVDGNVSQPTDPFIFEVDSDKPKIGNTEKFYLRKYNDNENGSGTVTASVEYSDGMWLKGEWWLEGSVEDENGITSVQINNVDVKSESVSVSKGNGANQWPKTSGYRIHHKVGNATPDKAGNLNYTLAITDGDNKTNEKTFTINYDNKAPTLAETSDDNYSISTTVKNSNGFYTIRSTVTEGSDESGFDKVVFYFKRTTAGFQNVYDSYMAKTYNNGAGQKVNTSNQFAYSGLTYEDYLYWKTATLSAVSGNTITITAKDENIHVGGLVKVDGTIYTIKVINPTGTVLTLNGNPSENATGTIYYSIGHVVDHSGAESAGTNAGKIMTADSTNKGYGYGYYSNSQDDDGDMMIETVSTSGTRTIWSASINSNNIPDGPIEIHYVAFDKAGNIAHGVVGASKTAYADAQVADSSSTSVANNAPRLAGVTIWSDYNGNGKGWRNSGEHAVDYDSETKSKYYSRVRPQIGGALTDRSNDVTSKLIVSSNDKGIEDTEAGTAYMKVTDTVKIIPEIVGGNDKLYYSYKIGKKSAFTVAGGAITGFTPSTVTGSKAVAGGTAASKLELKNDSDVAVSGNDEGDEYSRITDNNTTLTYVNGHTDGVITFDAENYLSALDNSSTEAPTWFDIKIWDSTEGGTPYSNTLSCEMQIALNNQYNDETSPEAWVRPFYWKQRGKPATGNDFYNSISWNDDDPAGHIELETDLNDAIKNLTVGSTALGSDPKVSGEIVIEGYAYDNIRLKGLYAQFSDHNGFATYQLINEYSGGWANNKTGTGWSCITEDIYSDANGHLAHWILTLDTSEVSNHVGLDKFINVFAVDERGTNTNTTIISGTTITGNNSYSAIPAAASQKVPFAKWSEVKTTVTPATQTTYFTDAACTTLANAQTTDATVVYRKVSYYKMDVVPYITGVNTNLSTLKANNPSVYSRTAQGHYPVNASTVSGDSSTYKHGYAYFTGFNIAGATVYDKNGTTNLTLDTDLKVAVANIHSGDITLKVNAGTAEAPVWVESLNNINANNAKGLYDKTTISITGDKSIYDNYYNRQPNGDNNNNLTDDIVFDVWQFNSQAAKAKSGAISDPVMKISPTSGMIGFAFTNGPLYFSMPGTVAKDSRSNNPADEYSYFYWQGSYDFMSSIGMAYDSTGHTYGCAAGGDINSTDADRFSFMTDRWGVSGAATGGSYAGSKALRLEAIAQKNNTELNFDKNRVMSPVFATHRNESSTDIYMAYYDHLNGEIRFRSGTLDDNKSKDQLAQYSSKFRYFGQFVEGYTYKSVNNGGNLSSGAYDVNYVQVLAKADGSVLGSNYYSGEYVSMDVTSDNKVVLVWYDSEHNNLMYTYNTNPTSITNGYNKGNWENAKVILSGAGEYCQLVVDSDNHIHVAAYDSINGDLKYVYIPAYNSAVSDMKSCTVDSYLNVGDHITIDVAKDGDNQVPYIGYWGSYPKKARYAKLVKPEYLTDASVTTANKKLNGVALDIYTGVWESTIVPSSSKLIEDRINVGVWKHNGTAADDGKLAYSTTGTDRGKSNGDVSTSSAGAEWGKCYGNGTNNAVLGYAIAPNSTTGFIETAQMK